MPECADRYLDTTNMICGRLPLNVDRAYKTELDLYNNLYVTKKIAWIRIERPAPNCIKHVLDLPGCSGQSGLTLQLFQMVILVNQVCRYNCFHWKQL